MHFFSPRIALFVLCLLFPFCFVPAQSLVSSTQQPEGAAVETCQFFQSNQGYDYLKLQQPSRFQFEYIIDETTGECIPQRIALQVDSLQKTLFDNLFEVVSSYYGNRFSKDFQEISSFFHDGEPISQFSVYETKEWKLLIDPKESGEFGVLIQFQLGSSSP